jgi:ribosomal protein S18 acetylase RimI-like enzyme
MAHTDPALSLRDARLQDVESILNLWDVAYATDSTRSLAQDVPRLLSQGPSARLILAEAGGGILGTLIAAFDGWRGNMYRLAVHPDHRRNGVAKRLVEEAHAWLHSIGCQRITALVEGDHAYATGFWQSAGYKWDAQMRRYSLNLE